ALAEDPFLPSGRCDLVLTVNAYHHFPEPKSYLLRVARALRPGGRIAIIDFHEKTEREQLIRDAKAAALRVTAEHLFLPQQHFLVFACGTDERAFARWHPRSGSAALRRCGGSITSRNPPRRKPSPKPAAAGVPRAPFRSPTNSSTPACWSASCAAAGSGSGGG